MQRLDHNTFSAVVASGRTVLVDFYSDTCVPCKRLAPVLAKLEERFAGRVEFAKVNIAFSHDLVEQYGVQAAPTLVLFRDGQEVARRTGAASASDLTDWVNSSL